MKLRHQTSAVLLFTGSVATACGGIIAGQEADAGLSCSGAFCVDAASPDGEVGQLDATLGGSSGSTGGGVISGNGASGSTGGSGSGSGSIGSSGAGVSSGGTSSTSSSGGTIKGGVDCGALLARDPATLDAGSWWSCYERICAASLLNCASEACCNNVLLGALDCTADGGAKMTCFTPVATAGMSGMPLITCLLQNGQCNQVDASAPDGG